jgi:hypothetical protein
MRTMKWIGVALLAVGVNQARAAVFTAADSGWAPLFNGKNFEGLYSRMYNAEVTPYPNIDKIFNIRYPGTDSVELYLAPGGGEIGTIRNNYRHYRVRIQYRFEQDNKLNAGLLYHVDETYPRMANSWPRSIECQMKQGEGADAFSIQQVAFDTRVTSNHWAVNGSPVKVCASGCNARNYAAYPRVDKRTQWNDMEAVVRGKDSAIHVLNGQEVFKLWNIRIADNSGKDISPWDSGALGLEAENAIVHYRRWEVMELPSSGPHFVNRLFLDAPRTGETLPPGKAYVLKWRSLGDFKKVSLKYNDGAIWKTLADSVDNTGSYEWTPPATIGPSVRIKVMAGASYVRPDSSGAVNISTRIAVPIPNAGRAFAWRGRRLRLEGVPASARLRITDVTGRMVREIPVGDGAGDLSWDGKNAAGNPVPAGFYFAGFAGSPARMRMAKF